MQKKNKNDQRTVLLELFFDANGTEKLVISMDSQEAESMILFSFAQVDYVNNNKTMIINIDEIMRIKEGLQEELIDCIQNKKLLHDSIKTWLGFSYTQYLKNDQRKNLIYETLPNGYRRWVGIAHRLFDAIPGQRIPVSWLYNDKDGNIILEISPIYPFDSHDPKPNEKFVRYLEWMKSYKPYVIAKIAPEVAKKWIQQLDGLMKKIEKSDKKFRCTGPGCKLCAKEGKSGCPCGS